MSEYTVLLTPESCKLASLEGPGVGPEGTSSFSVTSDVLNVVLLRQGDALAAQILFGVQGVTILSGLDLEKADRIKLSTVEEYADCDSGDLKFFIRMLKA